MRSLLLVLLSSSVALADPKAVEALAKKNVIELGKLSDNDVLGFTETANVINHMGTTVKMDETEACLSGAVANSFYGCLQASIVHKPGAIVAGADAAKGIGWFQAPYTSITTADLVEDNAKPQKTAMRAGGIAIKNGAKWEIVAEMYSQLVSDKELLAGTDGKPASGAPKLSGDTKLAGVVAGWFTTGFEKNVATGTVVASGTSAAEFKTGAQAAKLAASFDKLKIGATKIDAKLFAKGAIGWVVADVMMPRKNGKGAVEMKVALVVIPDGTSWRWVSMQYQFPWNPIGR